MSEFCKACMKPALPNDDLCDVCRRCVNDEWPCDECSILNCDERRSGGESGRRPGNTAEDRCFDLLTRAGWNVSKRGWPDFFAFDNQGNLLVVEVKPHKDKKLKREQERVIRALADAGIPCYRYSPDIGFTRLFAPPEEGKDGRS